MNKEKIYQGIDQDDYGGMGDTGRIIRDAWVFGLLPETETCAGWRLGQIQSLYDKVHAAWEPYGHLASRLPPEIRERHERIYGAAVERARREGWNPELGDED